MGMCVPETETLASDLYFEACINNGKDEAYQNVLELVCSQIFF